MSRPAYLEPLSEGLYGVDTGFQRDRCVAAYLLVDEGRAAFIDTGPNAAVPRLLGALQAAGLTPGQVDWVIPTHVHLDHAGGCGALMRELPHARLLVHPRGARHLVDPSVLQAGASAVYGDDVAAHAYGELVPVAPDRVTESHDGQRIRVGNRILEIADTPGHARHHHCLWDERSGGWFTGDTFGISYRELDAEGRPCIIPTSSPVQFDPLALKASIERLMARRPRWLYLTHYLAVTDVPRLGAALLSQIDEMAAIGRAIPAGPRRHDQLKHALGVRMTAALRAQGCSVDDQRLAEILALDLELNAQGLAIWADRDAAAVPA
jgi:glyoxylase-like metal-dependent hydrolase (beta-lactamase superfamily II)